MFNLLSVNNGLGWMAIGFLLLTPQWSRQGWHSCEFMWFRTGKTGIEWCENDQHREPFFPPTKIPGHLRKLTWQWKTTMNEDASPITVITVIFLCHVSFRGCICSIPNIQWFRTNKWNHVQQITVHPRKLTWHWTIPIFNRKYIFKWWIFHCHVSFQGCSGRGNPDLETG